MDEPTRPEIQANGGKYPQTARGEQAIERLLDVLRIMVENPVSRALILREVCMALIEQHNASWDAALIERLTTVEERNPRTA